MASFEQQVANWSRQVATMQMAAFREASQSLIEEAQVPRAKGGKMPVDTGFLRNSGQAAINKVPSGQGAFDAVPLVLIRVQPGDRMVFGWTANYAVYMEARYAFMRSAAMDWQGHVDRAARKVSV